MSARSRRLLRERLRYPLRSRSTVRRLQILSGTAILALLGLCATSIVGLTQARDGVHTIGHGAGPQVVETANLYYALSDMDAQVANILVIGDQHELGDGREAALETYDQRRTEANEALLEASQLSADDPTEQRTVQELLDGLATYDQLRAEAILLSEQADHPPGELPEEVRETYDEAADLMRLELLPKAYNLALDRGSLVRTTYEEKHTWVLVSAIVAAVAGIVAVAALIRLQIFLRRRFRRRLSPFLVAATVGTAIMTVGISGFLLSEARHLQSAKEDGFDSVLALARARAMATVNHADQSRYLLNPDQATSYEQRFLENSQAIVDVPIGGEDGSAAGTLEEYRESLAEGVANLEEEDVDQELRGLLGDEVGASELEGHDTAILTVLQNYTALQSSDETMRAMAERGNTHGAIQFLVSSGGGEGTYAFNQFDTALAEGLTELHQQAFDDAIARGESGLTAWTVASPAVTLLLAGLVVAAARSRMAEYR
ncbi:hypothetical protein RIF23_15225 [Lipingzhangella sp. LS1_29]|uniref:Secreted protein n=1 Tax=Lipingzhangella rawalii TaxID=2055835 RepID=A0ABU2H8M3_9ACTN|nr:hypothetical protein [Lipingzhangella rawalii]MDS1271646.1 hypothetical protein [Lipingzhangella rawalii]